MNIKVSKLVALDGDKLAIETEDGEVLVMSNIQLVAGSFENMHADATDMSFRVKASSMTKATEDTLELYKAKLDQIKYQLRGDNDENTGH